MRLKRILRNRKAFNTMWPVVIILVSVLIMIFLLLFVKKNYEVGQSSSAQAACRSSVIAHSKFGTPINCPIELIKIKTRDTEDAKKAVADAMVRCWDSYGKGELSLFEGVVTGRGQKFCSVCSIISFTRLEEPIEGFNLYLTRNFFSRAGTRYNYHKYFAGNDASDSIIDFYRTHASEMSLDSTQKYALLFTVYHDRIWLDYFLPVTASYAGAVGASIVIGSMAAVIGIGVAAVWIGTIIHDEMTDVSNEEILSELQQFTASGGQGTSGLIITLLNTSNIADLGCEELPVGLTGITDEGPEELTPEADVRR